MYISEIISLFGIMYTAGEDLFIDKDDAISDSDDDFQFDMVTCYYQT